MVINKEFDVLKIKDLSNQIFDYLNLTFYDLESQLNTKIDQTKNQLETFADKHFRTSIEDLLFEVDKIKLIFPETANQIKEIANELKIKYEEIINSNYLDFSSIDKLKNNLNKYIDKIIV